MKGEETIRVTLTKDEASALWTGESYHGDPKNYALFKSGADKIYKALKRKGLL